MSPCMPASHSEKLKSTIISSDSCLVLVSPNLTLSLIGPKTLSSLPIRHLTRVFYFFEVETIVNLFYNSFLRFTYPRVKNKIC